MINLIRCDDRLIHGQCMVRLIPDFKIKHIIVIDDFTASNPTMKMVVEKIAMPGIKNEVHTVETAIEPIKQAMNDNVGTLIVFRFPEIARELFDKIADLPKSLMVGPVQKQTNDAVQVNIGTFLTATQFENLSYIKKEKGVDVYFQTVPGMKKVSWEEVEKYFK
ncbi:MAG: PTS sugar transporter subunit IIB [Erysipelotrichia bacterium]|nr:PTS sugar transporter subunit IIB [Erysipelotrichia bacterium]